MATYRYRVRDKSGKLVTGVIGSDSKENAAKHLEKMGYAPISIDEENELPIAKFFERFNRVKREDLNLFTRQMVTLLNAGIPITTSLNSLEKQTSSKVLKKVIQEIIRDIEAGNSFSEALTRQPRTFDVLYTNTVRAGEVSGMMDEILDRLADLGEHEADTISKIKAVTLYPIFTFCALVAGSLIITTVILPNYVRIFSQMNIELPLITRIMMGISFFVTHYWYIALLILGIFIYSFIKFINTSRGRYICDNFTLKMPIFGPLLKILIMSRFARIMSIMVKSGVPILDVLDTVSRAVGNAVISSALSAVKNGVQQGRPIAEPMRISGVFSPMVLQMVAVGEESGTLDDLLLKVSEHYDKQVEYKIKNLATVLEPLLIVILGVGVLFLALSLFLPMWNFMRSAAGGM